MKKATRKLLVLLFTSAFVISVIVPVFALAIGEDALFPEEIERFSDGVEPGFPSSDESDESETPDPEPPADEQEPPDDEFAIPVQIADIEMPAGDTVTTEEELSQWCEDNRSVGGTVSLGGNITITNDIWCWNDDHVIINTGEFGITYDGGKIDMYDFEIIGEGVDCPVVTVIDIGETWGSGNWNNKMAFTNITSAGRDGFGGTALRVTRGDGDLFNMMLLPSTDAFIRSYGKGAVGLLLDVPLELYCFNIEVSGTNSTAVSAPGGTVLYYSRLAAFGDGAATVRNAGVVLDACIANPVPSDSLMIERSCSAVSTGSFYAPVRKNDKDGFYYYLESTFTFWLRGSDGSERTDFFWISWDWDALTAIDTSFIGKHYVQGRIDPVLEGFGLTDDVELNLVVDVRDPDLPCIGSVNIFDRDGFEAYVFMWDDCDFSKGEGILRRSDDGGESWYDFTGSSDIEQDGYWKDAFVFHFESLPSPVMFYVEIPGMGESNVLALYERDGMICKDLNGGRIGEGEPGAGKNDTEEDEELPDPGDVDHGITSEESLNKWVEENGDGGTVFLEADITIRNGISGGWDGGHIIIDTGRFGIIYDGGNISLYDFEIVGEGVDRPVVTVIDAGPNWGMGNWNNNLAFQHITAYGREGLGGVALHITQGDGAAFDMTMADYENYLIRSYGEGAIGILLDEPLDIYCFNVETDGMNSIAVSAPYGATLFYCRLLAAGTDAAAVSGGGVTLDACTAYPANLDASVITRTFSEVSGKHFYLPVRQHDFWIWPEGFYTFWMLGSDGSETRHVFLVEWDWEAIAAIDTGVLGSYEVQGDIMPVYQGFGLTDSFPLTLTIEVRDPDYPCIAAVYFSDWDGNKAALDLWKEYDPSEGNVILWLSDDGGETWYDFTDSPDLEWPEWNRSVVIFQYESITSPIMFCLEVVGIGESNIVTLYEKDGVPYGDTGGDRTGTDRPGGGDYEFESSGDYDPEDGGGRNDGGVGGNGNNGVGGDNNNGNNSGNGAGNGDTKNDANGTASDSGDNAEPNGESYDENGQAASGGLLEDEYPTAPQTMREGMESIVADIEFPDIQTPLAQSFASVDGSGNALYITGSVSIICLSVLAWLRFRRTARMKK